MYDINTLQVLNQKAEAMEKMTPFQATMIAEGVDEPANRGEYLAAWQFLHNSGLAYRLQGWFGRNAQAMLENGLIDGGSK